MSSANVYTGLRQETRGQVTSTKWRTSVCSATSKHNRWNTEPAGRACLWLTWDRLGRGTKWKLSEIVRDSNMFETSAGNQSSSVRGEPDDDKQFWVSTCFKLNVDPSHSRPAGWKSSSQTQHNVKQSEWRSCLYDLQTFPQSTKPETPLTISLHKTAWRRRPTRPGRRTLCMVAFLLARCQLYKSVVHRERNGAELLTFEQLFSCRICLFCAGLDLIYGLL